MYWRRPLLLQDLKLVQITKKKKTEADEVAQEKLGLGNIYEKYTRKNYIRHYRKRRVQAQVQKSCGGVE